MAHANACSFPMRYPFWDSKVGRLSHVEPRVKPEVIAAGKGDDGIAWPLNTCRELDPYLFQYSRRQKALFMAQEFITFRCLPSKMGASKRFKALGVFLGYCIPVFRRTGMKVVDGEEVHIFVMSSECAGPHSKVEIGTCYAWQVKYFVISISFFGICAQETQAAVQTVYIPPTCTVVFKQCAFHVCPIGGWFHSWTKPPPKLSGQFVTKVIRMVVIKFFTNVSLPVFVSLSSKLSNRDWRLLNKGVLINPTNS
mmetsp:Transcript_24714/g.52688  ORF Transcript_24714/g.52688 Transcript_24714/m.52688 type:complete len:253 (+) Transcript_24714:732-1490(+)